MSWYSIYSIRHFFKAGEGPLEGKKKKKDHVLHHVIE